jgi:tetratricopeptide (TPR) repeat protein
VDVVAKSVPEHRAGRCAFILSDGLYRVLVKSGSGEAMATSYRRFAVADGDSTELWLRLPGADPGTPRQPRYWPWYRELIGQVDASAFVRSTDPGSHRIAIDLMQYLYFSGAQEDAADLAARAEDDWSGRLETTDLHTLEAASYRGLFAWAVGNFQEARRINQRVLASHERNLAEGAQESNESIIARLRVAVDLRIAGDFAAALAQERDARNNALHLADGQSVVLQTAHDVAVGMRLCGDYRGALVLNERVAERRAELFGEYHPDTLNTRSGVYVDLVELGDYQTAVQGHREIAEQVSDLVGETSPEAWRRLVYLAIAERRVGNTERALELSGQVFQWYRGRYGPAHLDRLACAASHAINLRRAGRLREARELAEETLTGYRTALSDNHPHTLSVAVNVAVLRRLDGDLAGATELDEQTQRQLDSGLGPEHPHAIACAINHASDLAAAGQAGDAARIGADAFKRAGVVLDAEHPMALTAGLNLAMDNASQGVDTEDELRGIIDRYREVLGQEHPDTVAAARGERANWEIDPLPL